MISGVYALLNQEDIVYIGSSKDIENRINYHVLDKTKDFDSYKYVAVDDITMFSLEARLISKHRPRLNVRIPDTEVKDSCVTCWSKSIVPDGIMLIDQALEYIDNDFMKISKKSIRAYRANLGISSRVVLEHKDCVKVPRMAFKDTLKLNINTCYILFLITSIMDNRNVLIDPNTHEPIKSFSSICKIFDVSKRRLDTAMKEINSLSILRKVKMNNKTYIAVNPFYQIKGDEISKITALAFIDVFRKELDSIDYKTLCIEYGINPSSLGLGNHETIKGEHND